MNKKALILCTFILWSLCTSTFAATLNAHVEPEAVRPGEAFRLILELDENAPPGLPSFDPLSHDFYIRGTAHSASYVFDNGQSRASTRWTITLVPKHAGNLTIPPIQVGKAQSKPIIVRVGTGAKPKTKSMPVARDHALFIKTKLSQDKLFLNQELIYTVKIFHNTSILDAAYQAPQFSDALTLPLGENRQYEVIENGRPYLVEEQKYAFFPQKTGHQILFPPKFQALIYDDFPRRAEATADSASILVKAMPEGFTPSTWLPAEAVFLEQSYDNNATELTEGHTLTRVITLKARGLPAELLPPIEIEKNEQFKIYPERPVLNNLTEPEHVVGTAKLKVNYLLDHAGTITLPEQTVVWFNTKTGKKASVTLPRKTLQIAPELQQEKSPTTATTPPTKPAHKAASNMPPAIKTTKVALKQHLSLLIPVLTLTLLGFLVQRRKPSTRANPTPALRVLKKACQQNNPKSARDALLVWARCFWPDTPILNLSDIEQKINHDDVTASLHRLSAALYCTSKAQTWQGNDLWQSLHRFLAQNKSSHKKNLPLKEPLPPINPKT